MTGSNPFFPPLSCEEDSGPEVTKVESFCVNCGDNGETSLLLTHIPFYRSVILSSFSCPHCGHANNEIQSAAEVALQGLLLTLQVKSKGDLNRTIVKSDYAAVSIPELELEIPSKSQKGEVTTVEGVLKRVQEGLEAGQVRRQEEDPEGYQKIQAFLVKLELLLSGEKEFQLVIRDPSGHSFISPPPSILPGQKDSSLTSSQFERTTEENHLVGYYPELAAETQEAEPEVNLEDEIHHFHSSCPSCGKDCETKMKLTKIPHFKEVVIMATDCDCGYRTNEVKSGSGIEEKGRRITLKVTGEDDLTRDVLKSETCALEIPELELHVGSGTLGGKFTTVEGLLTNIKEQLLEGNPLVSGDSADQDMKSKMAQFCERINKIISGKEPFTLVLDDPAGNSYLQNTYAPEDDPNMETVDYERNFEQNEELGLNDLNVGETIPNE